MLRRIEIGDIDQIVRVHLASFPSFFLSFLGHRFLKLYYLQIFLAPEKIDFIYTNGDGQISGFLVGAVNPRRFYSKLLKHQWFYFLLYSVVPILRKPAITFRIARALFYPSQNPEGGDVGGFFSMGVLPEYRKQGIGKELFKAAIKDAKAKGCKKIFLHTDHFGNDAINALVQSNGFKIIQTYKTPENRTMNEYCLDLSE